MKYLIGLLVFIFIIIFVIVKLLTGGSSDKPALPPSLASYASTGTTVRYSIDNPVQAPETHRNVVIEVGNTSTIITITKGYQDEIIRTKSYPMSEEAYANFLLALDHTGNFTAGNSDKSVQDERGYCANGNRFSYDIVKDDGSLVQHYWSTTCGERTFKGKADAVQQLFTAQVPDYDALTEDIAL